MTAYSLDLDDRGWARCVCCKERYPVENGSIRHKSRRTQHFVCSSCSMVDRLMGRHSDRHSMSSITELLRGKLEEQGGICALTGELIRWGHNCSADHIDPVLDGRRRARKSDRTVPLDLENIQIASVNANSLKGKLTPDQYRRSILIYSGCTDLNSRDFTYRDRHSIRSSLISNLKFNSKQRGHDEPTIDHHWIAEQIDRQNGRCYWSGTPLPDYQFNSGTRPPSRSGTRDPVIRYFLDISIDRLDESIGYHPDNCVVCLMYLNLARSGGSARNGQINPLTISDPEIYKQWVTQVISGTWDLDWCRKYRGYLG